VTVELGDKTFMLSGMEEGLLGLKAGEDKSFDSEVSKNFQDAVISGKKVQVHALVKKTLSPVQHKLDDAFAKEFGYDSFDALKEAMKTNVTRNYESVARLYLKRHMLDALEGMYSFDLPKSMVENEFKTIWTHLQSEIEDAKSKGEFDESDSKPEEELRTEYMGIAERRVKLGLVISEISRAEKIQLSQDELRNALYREATKYPGQERQVMDHFKNHPHSIERIAAPILEDKVVDHIATKAKITETQVNVQDLKKKVKGVVPSFFDNEEETA
jgi:trigger factor